MSNLPLSEAARRESRACLEILGYSVPTHLPLIDNALIRSQKAIVDRTLVLSHAVASAYQFPQSAPRQLSLDWIRNENLIDALTRSELHFLETGDSSLVALLRSQEEALWAFVWLLGFLREIPLSETCDARLVTFFPSMQKKETSASFRTNAKLRSSEQVLMMLDLLYCAHWGIRDAEIRKNALPGRIPSYVVVERRRALEWATGSDEWENVTLDT